ncbi:Phosphatidylinositol-3,4,5-trisphosphate 5-phosphatase 2, partial [Ophiophagus hannah]
RQLIKSQRVQNKLGIVFEKEKDKTQRKDFVFVSARVSLDGLETVSSGHQVPSSLRLIPSQVQTQWICPQVLQLILGCLQGGWSPSVMSSSVPLRTSYFGCPRGIFPER